MATDQSMIDSWYQDYLKSPPTAQTYTASQAGVTNWSVGKDQTVQGQLESVLNKDGMLMQRAATQGRQTAAKRGLLNSSLGIQAGEEALYGAAMPIASQDAGTYASAAQFNANAANTASIANAGFKNEAGRFNAGAKNDMAGMIFRTAADFGLEDSRQRFQSSENLADRTWRTGERIGSETFQAGQSALDRDWRTGERLGSQQYGTSEREASQGWQSGENLADRTFRSAEREAAQRYGTSEREASQAFQSGENSLQRAFQTGERIADQDFRAVQMTLDRDQQLRIQQLQEGGMDRRQAETIAAQERSQKADQVFTAEQRAEDRKFQAGEREATQTYQAGQAALDRAFRTGERVSSQDFQAVQATLDRDQQLRIQQLQEQGVNQRQAEQIAAQERQQKASQVFTAEQAATDREFQQQQQATQFAQTLERDQVLFDNNLKTMVAQTEQELRLIDAQNGTNLSTQYRSATQASYDGFIAEVTAIQQSDMDADVKAAQVASLQSLFQSRQDYINVIFGNMPGWSSDWSQFALEFEGTP